MVAAAFMASVIIFIASFFYLDKKSRKSYYYTINIGGVDVGSIQIDRFATEDKYVYKSSETMLFAPLLTETKSRLEIGKDRSLDSYARYAAGDGAEEAVKIEKDGDTVSFVSVFGSEFFYSSTIPDVRPDTFIFEETSPVTYLPIIDSYDFNKGRAQGFSSLTQPTNDMPPIKRYVTLTSINNEYLKIDSRKIKTEHLLLKIRYYPKGEIWVSKYDRSLVMIHIPSINMKIRRSFSPKIFNAKEWSPSRETYRLRDVEFKSKGAVLAGTLRSPITEGKHPAVIFVGRAGPADRNYYGLFASIADATANSGYVALTYDQRGSSSSSGNPLGITISDEKEDVLAAVEFLSEQPEVDPSKISIVSHNSGFVPALLACSENSNIKTAVIISPYIHRSIEPERYIKDTTGASLKYGWGDEYLKSALEAIIETDSKVIKTQGNWTSILEERCFLERLRELSQLTIARITENVKCPILLVQGKMDTTIMPESAFIIDEKLSEAGNPDHVLAFFAKQGHWPGKLISDGIHRMHYEIDPEVFETIKSWLDKKSI